MSSEDSPALHELDVVALRVNLPAYGLVKGATGTIVHAHRPGGPFEVEFQRPGEEPVVETVEADRLAKLWDAATRRHVAPPHEAR